MENQLWILLIKRLHYRKYIDNAMFEPIKRWIILSYLNQYITLCGLNKKIMYQYAVSFNK